MGLAQRGPEGEGRSSGKTCVSGGSTVRKARGHLEWRCLKGRESAGQALRREGENLAAFGEGRRVSEAFVSSAFLLWSPLL